MEYYKKKYEEALEKLQELFQKGEKNNSLVINNYRKLFEEIFPELRESEDERIRKELIGMVEEDWPGRSDVLAWLEKQGEKPAGWSEEDKNMIYKIRDMIFKYAFSQSAVDVNGDLCEKEYIEADGWMESLKNRVFPQQQEWSEEDERLLNVCICTIDGIDYFCPENKKELTDWLKSLRSHWKPSKEQIIALRWIMDNIPYCTYKEELSGLLEQLKKLIK